MFPVSFCNPFLEHLAYCIDFASTSTPTWIGET